MHSTYVASNKLTLSTDACLHGVHRTRAETAAVSDGTSHVTTKQRCDHFIGYGKTRCVKLQSLIQSRERLERTGSARKQ